ncbi:hypothetical protein B0H66DRAFT_576241 [Apodospora peruviana]|uniref:Pyrroloquinoline quinone-dependent pyranose dehydrogenase beta-propeller domain-containing protein n=1 Tax=Apodospora peruviana TaxID=516989 RepID=A0AAE0I1C4_9PEZI|nr:hypothetical protein B0H66DRAFT_576241 [Apodospora peruviana]
MASLTRRAAIAALLFALRAASQSCSNVPTASYPAPVVADGYNAQLIITGLSSPRGMIFDQKGALLVVEKGAGVTHITLQDNGGTCLSAGTTTRLIDDKGLNHGIELSADGKALYASTSTEVFSYAYDDVAISVSNQRTLIGNMSTSGHVTRTLLLSRKQPGLLLVSQGSSRNIDPKATQVSSGISQIRAFNISDLPDDKVYSYASDGKMLGWGLRNSVGVAEEPMTGGIFSVENSADQVSRMGTDIHEEDPGEEMNFHGFLNGSTESWGGNYGYPDCLALWGTGVPELGSMKVGSQFSYEESGSPVSDEDCARSYVAPRLTFEAHTAPLDIKFNKEGTLAYVSFHGSWNRDDPAGYKLSVIAFANGQPTEPTDSTTAAVPVLSNQDTGVCPGNCFRPAGLAFDSQDRLFMTSDSTGEIYVLQRTTPPGGDGGSGVPGGGSSPSGGAGTGGIGSSNENAATTGAYVPRNEMWLLVSLTLTLSLVGGAFLAIG